MLITVRGNGLTLIEVLIAAFILGVSLLAVAGLQSCALRIDQGAYVRSQATFLAGQIADRMRANSRAVDDGRYDIGAITGPGAEPVSARETPSACSAQQMATHDLVEWSTSVVPRLPRGEATVCIDSSPDDGTAAATPACDVTGSTDAIKIRW